MASAQPQIQFRLGFSSGPQQVRPQPQPLPRGIQRVPTTLPNQVLLPQQPCQSPALLPTYPVLRVPQPVLDVDYLVYVRSHPREPWSLYGKYDTVRDVRALQRALLSRGVEVDVIEKVREAHPHHGHNHGLGLSRR
jgi:hypothetical protein